MNYDESLANRLPLPLIVLPGDVPKQRSVLARIWVEEQRQERRREPIRGHGDEVGCPDALEKGDRAVPVDRKMSGRVHVRDASGSCAGATSHRESPGQ